MSEAGGKYRVLLEVSGADLGVVLEGLSGPSVTLVSVSPAAGTSELRTGPPGPRPKQRVRYANGVRDKGISGTALLLELLAEGPMTGDQLSKRFVERGFAASTASSALSQMRAGGKVTFSAASGKWSLANVASEVAPKNT